MNNGLDIPKLVGVVNRGRNQEHSFYLLGVLEIVHTNKSISLRNNDKVNELRKKVLASLASNTKYKLLASVWLIRLVPIPLSMISIMLGGRNG